MDKLFTISQEVTPVHNSGRYRDDKMFGKIFHVHRYWPVLRDGIWYIMLTEKQVGPSVQNPAEIVPEWWDQRGFAPVLDDFDLEVLLLQLELVNVEDQPVIIGPGKLGALGI